MDTRAVNTVFRQTRIIEVAVSGSAQEIAIHQQKFDLSMNIPMLQSSQSTSVVNVFKN